MCLWLTAPQLVSFSRPTNALNTLLTFVTRLAGILTSTSSTFLQPCRLASARLQPSMATMEKKKIHYSIASVICGNLRTSASGYTYLARLRKSTKLSMLRYDHTTTQYFSGGQAHKLTNYTGNWDRMPQAELQHLGRHCPCPSQTSFVASWFNVRFQKLGYAVFANGDSKAWNFRWPSTKTIHEEIAELQSLRFWWNTPQIQRFRHLYQGRRWRNYEARPVIRG